MFSLEKAENVRFKAGGIRKSSNPLGEFHPVSYFRCNKNIEYTFLTDGEM